jgi:hypothetical protein
MKRHANLVLQLVIVVMLLLGLGFNVAYWRAQRAFNESTLARLSADEARLSACGCDERTLARAISIRHRNPLTQPGDSYAP